MGKTKQSKTSITPPAETDQSTLKKHGKSTTKSLKAATLKTPHSLQPVKTTESLMSNGQEKSAKKCTRITFKFKKQDGLLATVKRKGSTKKSVTHDELKRVTKFKKSTNLKKLAKVEKTVKLKTSACTKLRTTTKTRRTPVESEEVSRLKTTAFYRELFKKYTNIKKPTVGNGLLRKSTNLKKPAKAEKNVKTKTLAYSKLRTTTKLRTPVESEEAAILKTTVVNGLLKKSTSFKKRAKKEKTVGVKTPCVCINLRPPTESRWTSVEVEEVDRLKTTVNRLLRKSTSFKKQAKVEKTAPIKTPAWSPKKTPTELRTPVESEEVDRLKTTVVNGLFRKSTNFKKQAKVGKAVPIKTPVCTKSKAPTEFRTPVESEEAARLKTTVVNGLLKKSTSFKKPAKKKKLVGVKTPSVCTNLRPPTESRWTSVESEEVARSETTVVNRLLRKSTSFKKQAKVQKKVKKKTPACSKLRTKTKLRTPVECEEAASSKTTVVNGLLNKYTNLKKPAKVQTTVKIKTTACTKSKAPTESKTPVESEEADRLKTTNYNRLLKKPAKVQETVRLKTPMCTSLRAPTKSRTPVGSEEASRLKKSSKLANQNKPQKAKSKLEESVELKTNAKSKQICSALGCSHPRVKFGCTFYSFPKNKKLARKWMTAAKCDVAENKITRTKLITGNHLRLCNCHFEKQPTPTNKVVPTIFFNVAPSFETEPISNSAPHQGRKLKKKSLDQVQDEQPAKKSCSQENDFWKHYHQLMEDSSSYKKACDSLKLLSLQNVKDSDSVFEMYTGLPNYAIFKLLHDYLKLDVEKVKPEPFHIVEDVEDAEMNSQQPLTSEEELFLFLVGSRTGNSASDLSVRFGVSEETYRFTFASWAVFVSTKLEDFYETEAAKGGDTFVAVDFTALFSDSPSVFCVKNQNSSRSEIRKLTFLCLNDKGAVTGVLTMPDDQAVVKISPNKYLDFTKVHNQFNNPTRVPRMPERNKCATSSNDIDRTIDRIKRFSYLRKQVDPTQLDIFERVFKACAYLTNFQSAFRMTGTLKE
ncbi:uncharacterized protein LOC117289710 [Asterias rubens]|uniref:uncharacterized protein LOC117289710 n=1 Tax=Asterias rubens TaxID=7604 RepID=UPI001455072C|nr:uncharacterized protein LOC117289710 [Asterias rubens]